MKLYCDVFPLPTTVLMELPGEEVPLPLYVFFQIELMQTQIRCDYSNSKHRRGRDDRLEKKLLRKIARTTEERESELLRICCAPEMRLKNEIHL